MNLLSSKSIRASIKTLLCTSVILSSVLISSFGNVAADGTITQLTSPSWSGYVASGRSFTRVEGEFVVPKMSCTAANANALFWVGFDGLNQGVKTTVEQDGIEAKCTGGTKPTVNYYAWWEMYPTVSVQALSTSQISIKPGDTIFAEVSYGNGFTMTIKNLTTHQSPSIPTQFCRDKYNCARQSADWIAERWMPNTSNPNVFAPLTKWATDSSLFKNDYASTSYSSVFEPMNYFNLDDISMNDGRTLAEVSGLKDNGSAFNDNWEAAQ